MRRLLGALLFLASCASAPVVPKGPVSCATPCGLVYTAPDCSELAKAEGAIVFAYAKRAKEFGSPADICAKLDGWKVEVHKRNSHDDFWCSEGGWVVRLLHLPPPGRACLEGLTEPTVKTVTVENDRFSKNALAHELGHVLSYYSVGGAHCDWERRGIKAAIQEVTGEKDDTPSEQGCVGSVFISTPDSTDGGA